MAPGSLGDDRIFEGGYPGGNANHGQVLHRRTKGLGRKDRCALAFRFGKDGSKATVDVYTGSLSDIVENYRRHDGASFLIRARHDFSITRFLHRPTIFDLKT